MGNLDRNGYAPSIMQTDQIRCFRCMTQTGKLDRHEVFGAANRQKSKRLGLWVVLCRSCHSAAHDDRVVWTALKQGGQLAAMKTYHWSREDFIKEIGRNYL